MTGRNRKIFRLAAAFIFCATAVALVSAAPRARPVQNVASASDASPARVPAKPGLPAEAAIAKDWEQGAFTFTRYELAVKVTPRQKQLEVRGQITLRNDSAVPQNTAELQISSALKWASIQSAPTAGADQPLLTFSAATVESDIDHSGRVSAAIVALAPAVLPGREVTLQVGYAGAVPIDSTRLQRIGAPAADAAHNDWDHIGPGFSGVRGVGSVVWYPVSIEPALLADGNKLFRVLNEWKARQSLSVMHVRFSLNEDGSAVPRAPANRILANGDREKSSSSASTRDPGVDYSFEPLGYRVPAFVIGPYQTIDTGAALVHFLGTHKDEAAAYGKVVDKLLPLVTTWFGPQRLKMEIVELGDLKASAFESGPMFFTPLSAAIPAPLLEDALVHSLTHSCVFSSRPWIYEGLAHFAQALELEQQAGRPAALQMLRDRRASLALAEPETAAGSMDAAGQSLLRNSDEVFYRSKAMFVWWMLRDIAGDEALQRALQAYSAQTAASSAPDSDPAAIQKLIEKQSKHSLEWFFDDWVYRDRGLPDLRVESVFTRPILGGLILVTGNLENLGAAAAEVPVTVITNGREFSSRILVKGHDKAVVRIEMPDTPLQIQINDGSVPESDISNNSAVITVIKKE